MRIGIDNALGIHPEALKLRAQRTQVLARNIANADTPGFKAQDLNFAQVLSKMTTKGGSNTLSTTQSAPAHAQHIALQDMTGADATLRDAMQYRVPLMPSLDGNTVDVQLEQTTFAENSVQFLTSLRILNGRLQGMLTAIKGE